MATPSTRVPVGPPRPPAGFPDSGGNGDGTLPDHITNNPLATGKPKISILGLLGTLAVVVTVGWAANGTEFNPVTVVTEMPAVFAFLRKLWPPRWETFLNEERTIIPTIQTMQIAVVGTIVGCILAFPFALIAARNLAPAWLYQIVRFILNIFRSVPDLIFALIFVSAVGLGTFPGTLALVFGSFASIAKVWAESIEAIDPRPVEATEAVGATRVQQIAFAVIPQALPNIVSYGLLFFESNVRSSFIVGVVGGGGLGQIINEELNLFRYGDATVHLLIFIFLVTIVDRASAYVRKRLV